jgi:exopolysaccharide biosynthesis polyprenyl glycosylphosphotransferase
MLRRFSARRIAGFFLLDWLGTLAMLHLATLLRIELGRLPEPWTTLLRTLGISVGGMPPPQGALPPGPLLAGAFVLAAAVWPISFVALSVYDGRRNGTLGAELRRVFFAICASTLGLAGALFFTYRETSRLLVVLFFVLDAALLLGARVAWYAYRRSENGRRARQRRRVLVVGAGSAGRRAVEQLRKYAEAELDLVGYVDDDPAKQGQQFEGLPVFGDCDQIPAVVAEHGIQVAVVALPLRAHGRLLAVTRVLQSLGVRVHVIPDLFALSYPGATLDGFGGIPVIDLGQPGSDGLRRLSKRVFDVAAASVLLILLSPLFLILAVLIRLESQGPVIYHQQRIGENGQPFALLKFRSMRADADADAHKAHVARLIGQNLRPDQLGDGGKNSLKMQDDPRITRVGRFIRKTSLDELPQLINVLRGEMSLVGPRPPLPYEVELYAGWHRHRLEALPGMTGWWQVKGRNRVSFDEMVRMDLYYIEHASFWLDLKILLLTPWAALSGKGAG